MSESVLLLRVAVLPFQILDAFDAGDAGPEMAKLILIQNMQDEAAKALADELYGVAGARSEGDMAPELGQARNAVLALRRDVHNRRPLHRKHLESARSMVSESLLGRLERFHASVQTLQDMEHHFEAVYYEELSRERQALQDAGHRPEFEESVWLASRSLFEAFRKLSRRDVTTWRNEETHPGLKILAYLIRGATKTSPNALFAATAEASFGQTLAWRGSPNLKRVRTRLNVHEVRKVTACLARDPVLRSMIRPRPNATLRTTPEGWSWWREASLLQEEDEEVFLEAGHSPILDRIVDATRSGEPTWFDLVDLIAKEAGTTASDAERFLETLVDCGILLAEVEIPSLEPDPVAYFAKAVRDHSVEPAWLASLDAIERGRDTPAPVGSPDRLSALAHAGQLLDALPHARPLTEDELFRVDAVSGFQVELPQTFRQELWQAADAYVRMFAALYPFTRRELYADLFLEQFPADTDVPALDLYRLFSEPEFETALGALPEPPREVNAFHALKNRLKYTDAPEIRLDIDEFLRLVPFRDPGRWMAGALFQIAMPRSGDASHPNLRLVLNGLFHGCGLALSRFHDLHEGDAIQRTLHRGWSSLLPEGAIPAEINYLPWGRTANASLRPRLFEHEIELPGERGSANATTLPLQDLMIRYGSEDRRFHITSGCLGREIVPILSSGVRPQGFASFLVHAGMQDLFPVAFFPGLDDPDVVHWPRLTLGRVVLFRRRWVFGRDQEPEDRSAGGPRWFVNLQRWREGQGLPERVFVGSSRHGKPFFVNFKSPLMAELFRRFLVSLDDEDRCVVSEMLPGPDELWLGDETDGYASEFLTQLEGGFR
jgi:hypothetical protein